MRLPFVPRLSSEAKVGLTVFLAAVLLIYMTFRIAEYRPFQKSGYRLTITFSNAAGLYAKSPVKAAGVDVGRVETIKLVEGMAHVEVSIRPEFQFPKGSLGAIRSESLLGEKFLEIIAGQEEGVVAPGETIGSVEAVGDLDFLIFQATTVANELEAIATAFREGIASPVVQDAIRELTENFRDLAFNLNELVTDTKEDIRVTAANIRVASQTLREEAPRLVRSLTMIAERIERGEGTLGKLVTDEHLYEELDRTVTGLRKFSEKLEQGKGTLGRLVSDEQLGERVEATITSLHNALSIVDRTRLFIGLRNEFQFYRSTERTDLGNQHKGYFSVHLQTRPERFYLLELAEEPRGTVTSVGSTVTTKSGLKVSAEFGFRFEDVALRLGLIESTFGAGADYLAFRDRLRLSLDAWDFDPDDPEASGRPRLKATLRIIPTKYFFLQGGYDFVLTERLDVPFVGIGLQFEDQDLKYLIGRFPVPTG